MWGAMIVIIAVLTLYAIVLYEIGKRESDYDMGWADHEKIMQLYEMSPDDEALLKELKGAVKLYIKHNGLYRSGDVKRLESTSDFKDFKDVAWSMTVRRKEQ